MKILIVLTINASFTLESPVYFNVFLKLILNIYIISSLDVYAKSHTMYIVLDGIHSFIQHGATVKTRNTVIITMRLQTNSRVARKKIMGVLVMCVTWWTFIHYYFSFFLFHSSNFPFLKFYLT